MRTSTPDLLARSGKPTTRPGKSKGLNSYNFSACDALITRPPTTGLGPLAQLRDAARAREGRLFKPGGTRLALTMLGDLNENEL